MNMYFAGPVDFDCDSEGCLKVVDILGDIFLGLVIIYALVAVLSAIYFIRWFKKQKHSKSKSITWIAWAIWGAILLAPWLAILFLGS